MSDTTTLFGKGYTVEPAAVARCNECSLEITGSEESVRTKIAEHYRAEHNHPSR